MQTTVKTADESARPFRQSDTGPWMGGVALGALIAIAAMAMGAAFTLALVQSAAKLPIAAVATPATAPKVAVQTDSAAQLQPTVVPDVASEDTLAGAPAYTQLGRETAPVKIVVFADPQCPFCQRAALGSEKQLIAEYVETGKASLTYRHFAFLGPESFDIAVAMDCAGKQGKFWPFHELVFANQASENSGQSSARLKEWASSAGLDGPSFEDCRKDNGATSRVAGDTSLGRKLGVAGTPTVFINGRRIVGAVPYEMLKSVVDFALSGRK